MLSKHSLVLIVLTGLSALASVLLVGGARSATSPSSLIAFARSDGVYVMDADGSNVHALWQRWGASVNDVAWSPDGRRLAFGTPTGLRVMNADGSEPTRIAKLWTFSVTWSPDGGRVAFSAAPPGGKQLDLAVIDADGSNLHWLTRTPKLFENNVDWSPAGDSLTFDRGGPYMPPFSRRVYVMKTDASNLRRLHPDPWPARYRRYSWSETPDWSPDGRRIAFSYYTPYSYEGEDIWVMNANGKALVKLTTNFIDDSTPAWSPDGQQIIYVRYARGGQTSDIIVMNTNGGRKTTLTHGWDDHNPAWQPIARDR